MATVLVMVAWDIDPPGVRTVLGATGGVAQEFDVHRVALQVHLDGAFAQVASALLTGELGEFGTVLVGEVAAVFTRTEACLSGAGQATAAYVDGDLEMAANAQTAASAAPDPAAIMPGPR